MHKLIEYVCDELKELEHKAEKDGKLSMAEVQYMDVLAHAKKNLLTGEAMMEAEDDYSGNYRGRMYPMYGRSYADSDMRTDGRSYNDERSYDDGRSYAGRRNVRRDAMSRYSSRGYSRDGGMIDELRDLMEKAPDDRTRKEFERFIEKVENMA